MVVHGLLLVVPDHKNTKILAKPIPSTSDSQRFAADGTVLKIFRKFLVALFVHDMWTVGRLDDLFPLKAGSQGLAAYRTRRSRKV